MLQKNCRHCQNVFSIRTEDEAYYDRVSPIFGQQKFAVPTPSLCPSCRERRRMAFRNERSLYMRQSASGKTILSIYSPDKPFVVYDHDEWWGDGWDPLRYGRDFDFTKPFFAQFKELQTVVPRMNLYVDSTCENCGYSNQITSSKNCYLVYSGSSNEDSYYGYRFMGTRNCVDGLMLVSSELCYECIDAIESYNCQFSRSIVHCRDSAFLFDCQNCDNCFFSTNLRNKSYCLFNKQCTKEEYERERAKYDLGSYAVVQKLQTEFEKLLVETPHLFAHLKQTENVTGDNVSHAKDCASVFNGVNLEQVHYSRFIQDAQYCMDVNFGCDQTILNYEVCTTGVNAYNVLFSIDTWPNVSNLLYCDSCANGAKDCFGCIGVRGKQYCILNKQYSKEDYEQLMSRIIEHMQKTGEWGEFFPPELAPIGYNESMASEYYPLPEDDAKKLGFTWSHFTAPEAVAQNVIQASALSDHIDQIDDSILTSAIRSISSPQLFRITKQELAFYRDHHLPLPRLHPNERYALRLKKRGALSLIERACTNCQTKVETVYSDAAAPTLYCERCYLEKVY